MLGEFGIAVNTSKWLLVFLEPFRETNFCLAYVFLVTFWASELVYATVSKFNIMEILLVVIS